MLTALATGVNTLVLTPELRPATQDLAQGLATTCPYPEAWTSNFQQTISTYTGVPHHVPPGQPFALGAIARLAEMANDPDHGFPAQCAQGLPLGVEEELPEAHGIWPSKTELTGVDQHEPHIDPPRAHPNYPSAKEHEDAIEATYIEDRTEGMVSGPHTPAEAANICGCQVPDLCHGALAGKLEGRYLEKLRTIHGGTISQVNFWIKRNQKYRTTAPGLQDLATALRLSTDTPLSILKLDVTKAHRRIKILP